MAKRKTEKYHIYAYLCSLILVGILLTGVTLARYSGSSSGGGTTNISGFFCSYDIDDASSLTFSNADYWLTVDDVNTPINTARSVRYTVRNYTTSDDGSADRISAVPVAASIRFYAPAEFAGNLALQVVEVRPQSEGGDLVISPQYVLKDIVAARYADQNNSDTTSYNTAPQEVTNEDGSVTVIHPDYEDRTDGRSDTLEETLTLSGNFTVTGGEGNTADHTGTITAAHSDGGTLTINSAIETATYSVGFMRGLDTSGSTIVGGGSSSSTMAPLVYIDCEKDVSFWTIDISLPEMRFDAGVKEEKTFVLYVTSVEQFRENEDMNSVWDGGEDDSYGEVLVNGAQQSYWDCLLSVSTNGSTMTLNGAKVTGYHFNCELPIYGASGDTGTTTTVRINKQYGMNSDGTYDGTATLSYDHIAPLSEDPDAATVAHPIEEFYTFADGTYTRDESVGFSDISSVRGKYGSCSNGGKSGYIYFNDVTDDPYYDTFAQENDDQDGTARIYMFSDAISKGFMTKLNMLFVQTAASGDDRGGDA